MGDDSDMDMGGDEPADDMDMGGEPAGDEPAGEEDEEAMLITLRESLGISDKQHANLLAKILDSIK